MSKVGYLGPVGSYSNLAAQKLCKGWECVAYPNFCALFKALDSEEVEAIAIPVENTVNGAVTQNLDLLEEYESAFAVKTYDLKLDHRLVTMEGARLEDIKAVYSHPQALEQCSKFLAEKLAWAKLYITPSTADGLRSIKDKTCAGIAGAHTEIEGLVLSPYSIADEDTNYTTFLKVIKGDPERLILRRCSKILVCFTLRHEAGSLCNALASLSAYGLNLTKIESRPIKDKPGEFRFFIEIQSELVNAPAALRELRAHSLSFKLLGGY